MEEENRNEQETGGRPVAEFWRPILQRLLEPSAKTLYSPLTEVQIDNIRARGRNNDRRNESWESVVPKNHNEALRVCNVRYEAWLNSLPGMKDDGIRTANMLETTRKNILDSGFISAQGVCEFSRLWLALDNRVRIVLSEAAALREYVTELLSRPGVAMLFSTDGRFFYEPPCATNVIGMDKIERALQRYGDFASLVAWEAHAEKHAGFIRLRSSELEFFQRGMIAAIMEVDPEFFTLQEPQDVDIRELAGNPPAAPVEVTQAKIAKMLDRAKQERGPK